MQGDLSTTNTILTVMAVVSVLEALLIVGAGIACFVFYRRVMGLVDVAESRYLAPAAARVNEILGDVKSISAKVSAQTDRVDRAIDTTVNRVDDTAERVRTNIRSKTAHVVGFIRGARVVIETLLQSRAA